MTEQLFTARRESEIATEPKIRIGEPEKRGNGEEGYRLKGKWGNGEGIKAKGGKGEVACVTCTGITNFVILAQPVASSTGSGNPVFGSWIPGLTLLARNNGSLVFVIPASYRF